VQTAEVTVREGTDEDIGFVLTTFSKSFREASAYSDHVPTELLGALITAAVVKYGLRVLVEPESPGVILGWSIVAPPRTVAWVFVAPAYRKRGAARVLLSGIDTTGDIVTCFAPTRIRWLRRFRIIFRPWGALR
jgi:GNAT superfamily N-acetyltransferase